jgi:NDP-sugar pyrophosphorylase family protein
MARLVQRVRAVDAMIFAAGLGTRLRPLTDRIPKPLVEVGGIPLVERVAMRLIDAGADRLVINTHHHAEQIERFLAARNHFGVDVRVSYEPDGPYDTGGGLRHAARHFRRDAPFFLHNADVLTDAPLAALYSHHRSTDALVTLAVRPALETRFLAFDDAGLCGAAQRGSSEAVYVRTPRGAVRRFDFAGIHVAGATLLDRLTEEGVFSIIGSYLRLAREGVRIEPFPIDAARWVDVGSFEGLARAEAMVGSRPSAWSVR